MLKKQQRSAGGYFWRYARDSDDESSLGDISRGNHSDSDKSDLSLNDDDDEVSASDSEEDSVSINSESDSKAKTIFAYIIFFNNEF